MTRFSCALLDILVPVPTFPVTALIRHVDYFRVRRHSGMAHIADFTAIAGLNIAMR
jgi:hypothetical protein